MGILFDQEQLAELDVVYYLRLMGIQLIITYRMAR